MTNTPTRIQHLIAILANTYVIYVKTQNFHWNVTGMHFHALHDMFESQYTELASKIDEIAERIRMLGHAAPGSMSEFLQLATIEESAMTLSWQDMLECLLKDHQVQDQLLQQTGLIMAEHEDEVSAGLVADLQKMHQMMLWVLRSHLVL